MSYRTNKINTHFLFKNLFRRFNLYTRVYIESILSERLDDDVHQWISVYSCFYDRLLSEIYIIIMSRRLRGYPWPSLAISPYHSSPPAGLQDYNPCPHIAAVCKFVLVVPHLHIHEWGSTGVHRLWALPCFSSSVLRVWFVELV